METTNIVGFIVSILAGMIANCIYKLIETYMKGK